MSIFYRSFTELFKTKIKKANLLMLIGLIGSFALTVFSSFKFESGRLVQEHNDMSFMALWVTCFFFVSFLLFIVFYCVTCVTHEQINGNQTWRLIPLSSIAFYTDNMLSSFVSAFCFAIYEALINVGLCLFAMLVDKKFYQQVTIVIKDIQDAFTKMSTSQIAELVGDMVESLILIILIGFLFYFIADFLNFSSRSITDFIPVKRGGKYIRITTIFLICIVTWAITRVSGFLRQALLIPIGIIFGSSVLGTNFSLAGSLLVMITLNAILLGINLLLYNKFYEAWQKK